MFFLLWKFWGKTGLLSKVGQKINARMKGGLSSFLAAFFCEEVLVSP